jgi:hypothetical protein
VSHLQRSTPKTLLAHLKSELIAHGAVSKATGSDAIFISATERTGLLDQYPLLCAWAGLPATPLERRRTRGAVILLKRLHEAGPTIQRAILKALAPAHPAADWALQLWLATLDQQSALLLPTHPHPVQKMYLGGAQAATEEEAALAGRLVAFWAEANWHVPAERWQISGLAAIWRWMALDRYHLAVATQVTERLRLMLLPPPPAPTAPLAEATPMAGWPLVLSWWRRTRGSRGRHLTTSLGALLGEAAMTLPAWVQPRLLPYLEMISQRPFNEAEDSHASTVASELAVQIGESLFATHPYSQAVVVYGGAAQRDVMLWELAARLPDADWSVDTPLLVGSMIQWGLHRCGLAALHVGGALPGRRGYHRIAEKVFMRHALDALNEIRAQHSIPDELPEEGTAATREWVDAWWGAFRIRVNPTLASARQRLFYLLEQLLFHPVAETTCPYQTSP